MRKAQVPVSGRLCALRGLDTRAGDRIGDLVRRTAFALGLCEHLAQRRADAGRLNADVGIRPVVDLAAHADDSTAVDDVVRRIEDAARRHSSAVDFRPRELIVRGACDDLRLDRRDRGVVQDRAQRVADDVRLPQAQVVQQSGDVAGRLRPVLAGRMRLAALAMMLSRSFVFSLELLAESDEKSADQVFRNAGQNSLTNSGHEPPDLTIAPVN